VTVADAIYALETDDGVVIQIRNRGLRHGPPEVMQRLAAGDAVDPAEYYFRTVPEFIAPKGRYEWMNRSIFICSGARFPLGIKLGLARAVAANALVTSSWRAQRGNPERHVELWIASLRSH
jgi:hypothetical protein